MCHLSHLSDAAARGHDWHETCIYLWARARSHGCPRTGTIGGLGHVALNTTS